MACEDVDSDGKGDCVECTVSADCVLFSPCHANALCLDDNTCDYAFVADCCAADADCDDGIGCTIDSCDLDTNECVNFPVPDCCVDGNETDPLGAPSFGCTPTDPHPCVQYFCIGSGPTARCHEAKYFNDCCAANEDCDVARLLTACVDPWGRGYARCAIDEALPDEDLPGAYVCDYGPVEEDCCVHDWQCADHYPQQTGTCTGSGGGGDYQICDYVDNLDYCSSPIDHIIITEIMIHTPDLGEPEGEWFEIFNPTAEDIDIEGWYVAQDESETQQFKIDTIEGEFLVPAGGFVTLAASSSADINGGFEPDYTYGGAGAGFRLDSVDAIVLLNNNTVPEMVDTVAWDGWDLWGNSESMALMSPYLDNDLPENWNRSKLVYGVYAGIESKGTPGVHNRDVFDEDRLDLLADRTCDDGNACTADICHFSTTDLCAHLPLYDCCQSQDAECNDYNLCSVDSCDADSHHCDHEFDLSCCVVDSDCDDDFPDGLMETALDGEQQARFRLCSTALCIAGQCRFGRAADKPGCCVDTAAGLGFGCDDRNLCTLDACTDDAAGNGTEDNPYYSACTVDVDPLDDPDSPDGDECCMNSAQCDDGDPTTIDLCARKNFPENDPDCPNVAQSTCCHMDNPLYCESDGECVDGLGCTQDICCTGEGTPHADCTVEDSCVNPPIAGFDSCCESAAQCSDGNSCTTDYCCERFGVPVAGCLAPNSCAHVEVDNADCCTVHDDCRGLSKPPEMFCREGYCIGGVCRFAPPETEECCASASDCARLDPTGCTTWECDNNTCDGTPIVDCCQNSNDCAQPAAATCLIAVCQEGACVDLPLPNCCVDEDPEEPDGECEDGNPCTVDYCIPVGNSFQCRSIGMGDPGCCATAQTCPDDHVQCTDRVCSANDCELQGEADCTLVSPYKMSFSEGHVIYGAQYESIATFGWSAMDRGTDGAAAFFGMDSNGDEGPDQHLALLPTGTVASFDACVALPPFDTRANYFAKLRFTFSAEVLSDGCQVHALAMKGTDWAEAVDMPGPGLDNNIPSTSFTFELPQDAMNSATTRVALCVMGPSTANLTAVRFDNVLLYKSKPYAFITDPCESHGKYGDGICDRGCTEVDPDCETSSAPTSDFCEEQGWYGDGICDAECPQPDPDCGDSGQSGGVTSGDICEEQGWYNDGICDEGCPNPDPDC